MSELCCREHVPQVGVGTADLEHLVRRRVVPLGEQASDEEQVDPAEHDVHREHRPDLDEEVEHHEHDAGREVEHAEPEHPGLQQREDQQGRAGPAQQVQGIHAAQAIDSSFARGSSSRAARLPPRPRVHLPWRACVLSLCREPGGPEVLEVREVPEPTPGPGEVVIDVAASAVNRADLQQRLGVYPPPPGRLATSSDWSAPARSRRRRRGRALAGRRRGVRAARQRRLRRQGRGTRRPGAPGAGRPRVWSRPQPCPRWPARSGRTSSCSPPSSLARPCSCTAVAGGIGTMAIQLAHALGAKVATTVGSEEKAQRSAGSSAPTSPSTTASRTSSRRSAGSTTPGPT